MTKAVLKKVPTILINLKTCTTVRTDREFNSPHRDAIFPSLTAFSIARWTISRSWRAICLKEKFTRPGLSDTTFFIWNSSTFEYTHCIKLHTFLGFKFKDSTIGLPFIFTTIFCLGGCVNVRQVNIYETGMRVNE